MKQKKARKGERLKVRVSFHGKFDVTERKAVASWLRQAASLFLNDPEYSTIRNFRLFV